MPEITAVPLATGEAQALLPAPRPPGDDRSDLVRPASAVFDVLDEYPLVRYAIACESHLPQQ
jgi:hypothetical protein